MVNHVNHEKNDFYFPIYWLVNDGILITVYEIIPIYLGRISSPTNPPINQGPFFSLLMWKKWPRISLLSFRTNRPGDALTGGIGSRTVSTLSGQTSKSSTKIWIFVTISWGGLEMGFIIHLFLLAF